MIVDSKVAFESASHTQQVEYILDDLSRDRNEQEQTKSKQQNKTNREDCLICERPYDVRRSFRQREESSLVGRRDGSVGI